MDTDTAPGPSDPPSAVPRPSSLNDFIPPRQQATFQSAEFVGRTSGTDAPVSCPVMGTSEGTPRNMPANNMHTTPDLRTTQGDGPAASSNPSHVVSVNHSDLRAQASVIAPAVLPAPPRVASMATTRRNPVSASVSATTPENAASSLAMRAR